MRLKSHFPKRNRCNRQPFRHFQPVLNGKVCRFCHHFQFSLCILTYTHSDEYFGLPFHIYFSYAYTGSPKCLFCKGTSLVPRLGLILDFALALDKLANNVYN